MNTSERRVIVRYRVKPGQEDTNAELVRAVYEELHSTAVEGIRYATFQSEDGRDFVHIAVETADEPPRLPGLAAFRRFQEGIGERCEEKPVVTQYSEVGSYRAFTS